MNTREGINPSPLLRTILIATGLLVTAVVFALNFAAPQVASGDDAGCDNEEFRTGASAYLPDCRAYEQVSAVRKFGNAVWGGPPVPTTSSTAVYPLPGWASPAGDRAVYFNQGGAAFEGAARGFYMPVTSERFEDGWKQRATIDGPPGFQPLLAANASPRQLTPSADLSAVIFNGSIPYSPLQPPSVPASGGGGVHFAGATGAVTWLSNPTAENPDPVPGEPGPQPQDGWHFAPVAVSEDHSTVYFMSRARLTPEDEQIGRAWSQTWAFYKVKNGVLSNAGTLPDGTVDLAGSVSAGWDVAGGTVSPNAQATLGSVNVVSPDGKRALFIDRGVRSAPGAQLYMHRDGLPSLLISKSPGESEPIADSTGIAPIWAYSAQSTNSHGGTPNYDLAVATADRDLGVVIFATRDALLPGVPDDGTRVNTYRYDVAADELEYLTDLDRPGGENSRRQQGNVYRVSDDATRILFWTNDGELKLWRHNESTLTLATGLETSGDLSTVGARFSGDGRTLVFMSRVPIGDEPDHPAGGGILENQIYRFEEGVDTEPQCISCPEPGASTVGPASFDIHGPGNTGFGSKASGVGDGAAQTRGISADGRRVFFTTTSTLDSRDENSTADVYQWSAGSGLALISSGDPDSRGEGLIDIDEMGDNVFFVSEQRLTGSDTDELYDLYVARVRGGLPDPEPFDMEEGCETDTCQGQSSDTPAAPTVGSVDFSGKGNPDKARDPKASVKVKRLRSATGSRTKLRVDVPGPGEVTVNGNKLKRISKKADGAGTLTLPIKLKAKAKKALRNRGKVKAKVRVVYRSSDGERDAKKLQVTFKQPKSKRGSR